MVGVATKVTLVPAQTVVLPVVMTQVGVTCAVTVTVMVLLVAVGCVAQGELLVNTT